MNTISLLFYFSWCVASISPAEVIYKIKQDIDFTDDLFHKSFVSTESTHEARCSLQCLSTTSCCAAIYNQNTTKCYLYNSCDINCGYRTSSQISLMTNINEQIPCSPVYRDCQEVFESGNIEQNGIYTLKPDALLNNTVKAVCQFDDTSGWTVIQRRLDGFEDFYRGWDDYVHGFGNKSGEYWIGLETIYWLTKCNQKLSVYLEDHDGKSTTANYSTFSVGGLEDSYRVNISGYDGDAGDALVAGHSNGRINNLQFSTFDRDNDMKGDVNCAELYKGGWWYKSCHNANLNGIWYPGGAVTTNGTGASWSTWRSASYSYKIIYMKVGR